MLDLSVNLLMYLAFFIFVFKRHGGFSVNAMIVLFVTVIAFLGLCIYDTEYYNWGYYNWCLDHTRNKMSFPPLLFLFGGFLLYYQSIAQVNTKKIERIGMISPMAEKILFYFNSFFLILFLFTFRNAVGNVSNFADAYSLGFNGESYGFFGKYAFTIGTPLILIQVIFPFYLFTKNTKKDYIMGSFLLLLTMLMFYVKASLLGSRGVLFFGMIYVSFMYFFLRDFMSKKANKVITITGLSILGVFISLAIAISFDRFGDKMLYSIASYFGEPFNNFPLIYWNYPEFMGGDLMYAQLFGGDFPHIPLWLGYFRPMAGSIYVDFGVVGTLVFFTVYAIVWKKILGSPQKKMTMSQVYVYVFLYQGFIFGAFAFEVYNIKTYIMMVLIYLFLRMTKSERSCEKSNI